MAWGGKRPGSGRKPKPKSGLANVLNHPSVPTTNEPSPIEEFDAPDDLSADERAIWMKQAPRAFGNRTLTKSTALSFERYCQLVAIERRMRKTDDVGRADHMRLVKQINTFELQFILTACGKPVPESEQPKPAAQPESKLARFRKA